MSISQIDSTSRTCISGFNSFSQIGTIIAPLISISGFTIGESYYGTMRDFRF